MITICLSVFNPNFKFFKDLINSLNIIQEDLDFELLIRNDGSTHNIYKHRIYTQKKIHNFSWYDGENIGVNSSFLQLATKSTKKYIAFCDQDDVWEPNKLKRAIDILESTKKKVYCSNLKLIDLEGNSLGLTFFSNEIKNDSPLFRNYVVGCTTVFHKSYLPIIENLYQNTYHLFDHKLGVIAYENSDLIFDFNSYIKYRIHDQNVIGKNNQDKFSRLLRFRHLRYIYKQDKILLNTFNINFFFATWFLKKIKAHIFKF